MDHEHVVRPEGEGASPRPSRGRLGRAYDRLYHFVFEKKPSPSPPYHGNMQGATIDDPRYTPGLLNRRRSSEDPRGGGA